jgi:hypothetical protein
MINESEGIWKEAGLVQLRYYPSIWLKALRKTMIPEIRNRSAKLQNARLRFFILTYTCYAALSQLQEYCCTSRCSPRYFCQRKPTILCSDL